MLVRAHTHLSNRTKVRAALERKPVFRSVLENPFQVHWPSVPTNVQNVALACLVASLENIPPRTHTSLNLSHPMVASEGADVQTNPSRACVPGAFDFILGINNTTRALELQLRLTRKRFTLGHAEQISAQLPPPPSPIAVVFVCCADVGTAMIIDHIPHLIAGCNFPRNVAEPIKLIPLPKGSEEIISSILGVRRAAVIAFRRGSALFETVQDILDSVPTVSAPWLCHADTSTPQLVPTHVKQLRTTAPKDMKAAKEQRSKARAAAKKNASSSSRPINRVTLTTGSESGAV